MWIWIAPVVLSYVVFVFIAEHVNPFKKFREVTPRRRIKSGRSAALIALPLFFLALFATQFVLNNVKGRKQETVVLGTAKDTAAESDTKRAALEESLALNEPNRNAASSKELKELIKELIVESNAASSTTNLSAEKTDQTTTPLKFTSQSDSAANSDNSVNSDINTWLNAQNPKSFTVQLNASNDKASVDLFLKQSQLPEPNAIFAFKRNGATWYALVHGAYTSLGQANAALNNLPNQTKTHTPWVRRFDQLQGIALQQ